MDYYNLLGDWENFKKDFEDLKECFEKVFMKNPSSRTYSIRIRKKSKDLECFGKKIKRNVLKQRQDYQSDYS